MNNQNMQNQNRPMQNMQRPNPMQNRPVQNMSMQRPNQYMQGQNMGMQQGQDGTQQKQRRFITESARQIVDSGMINYPMKSYLLIYLRKRAVSIVLTVIIIILLLTSSVFTDFGFNIGDYILSWFN